MDDINLSEILNPTLTDDQAEAKVSEYCRIDLANLDLALSRHAALYAYSVAAYELAKVQEARAKWKLEGTKAMVFGALTEKDSKIAVAAADKKIPLAIPVKEAMEEMLTIQSTVARLRGLAAGLEHRRDMLVQISARQRQEMQT